MAWVLAILMCKIWPLLTLALKYLSYDFFNQPQSFPFLWQVLKRIVFSFLPSILFSPPKSPISSIWIIIDLHLLLRLDSVILCIKYINCTRWFLRFLPLRIYIVLKRRKKKSTVLPRLSSSLAALLQFSLTTLFFLSWTIWNQPILNHF